MDIENIPLNPIDIVEDVIYEKNGVLVELMIMNWLLIAHQNGVNIDCILLGQKK